MANPSTENKPKVEKTEEPAERSAESPTHLEKLQSSKLVFPVQHAGFGDSPALGNPSLGNLSFGNTLLRLPRAERSLYELPEKAREELLSKLSPEEQKAFLTEEKWHKLEQNLSYQEIRLLRAQGLNGEDLDAILKDLKQESPLRPGGNRMPIGLEYQLRQPTPETLARIDSLSRNEVIGTLGSLSDSELAELDPAVSQRLMGRVAGDPEATIEIQQTRYINQNILGLRTIRDGAYTNYREARENYDNSVLPEFLSNRTTGFRLERDGFSERHTAASSTLADRQEVLNDSLKHSRVARILNRHAARLEQSNGSSEQVAQLKNSAAAMYTASSQELFRNDVAKFNAQAGLGEIQQAGDAFRANERRLGYLETGMRYTRNGAVVIVAGGAATLSAPVVFGAVVTTTGSTTLGVIGTGLSGSAIGGGTGLLYGGTTSSLENLGHVALGYKTRNEALRDTYQQTLEDGHTGMISGLGSGTAGAIAKILNPASKVLPSWIAIRNGATSAAAASATTFSVTTTERIIEARTDFNKQYANSGLNEEQLAVKYAQHMKSYGLTPEALLKEGGMNLVFATFFGGSGAKFEGMRQAATSGRQVAAVEASEWGASTVVGFARAYFETPEQQRTFENLLGRAVDETFQNTYATLQGRASVRGQKRQAPPSGASPGETRPDVGLDSADLLSPEQARLGAAVIDEVGGQFIRNEDVVMRLFPEQSAEATQARTRSRIRPELFQAQRRDESALVGAGVTPGPEHLSAALDGPSYNADSGGEFGGSSNRGENNPEDAQIRRSSDGGTPARSPSNDELQANRLADRMLDGEELSLEERMNMLEHLKEENKASLIDLVDQNQKEKLELTEVLVRMRSANPTISPRVFNRLEQSLSSLQSQNFSIAELERSYVKNGADLDAVSHLAKVARLGEGGIELQSSDFDIKSNEQITILGKALEQGFTVEQINNARRANRLVTEELKKVTLTDAQGEQRSLTEAEVNRVLPALKRLANHESIDPQKLMAIVARHSDQFDTLSFVENLATLARPRKGEEPTIGIERLVDSLDEAFTSKKYPEGFLAEARQAARLKQRGNRILEVSHSFIDSRGVDREFDIVLQRADGTKVFVEVKGSLGTLESKNATKATKDSQVYAEARYAAENGGEYMIVVDQEFNMRRLESPQFREDQTRIRGILRRQTEGTGLNGLPRVEDGNGSPLL